MAIPSPADFKEVKYRIDDSYENFVVCQPPTQPEDSPFDPYAQFAHIIRRDWSEYSPTGKMSAIIVDTFTETTEEIQHFVATAGRGNAGVGETYGMDIDDPWAKESYRTTQMNDYGKSQEMCIALLRQLNRSEQFPHVIVLGHRKAMTDTKMVRQANGKFKEMTTVIGYDMDMPGKKWAGNMTKFFEQYLWHTNDGISEMDIRLHLRSDGKHQTKLRTAMNVPGEIDVPFSYKGMADVIRQVAKYSEVDMGSSDRGLRLCGFGPGGSGKTMLWTSLPPETFEVGPALYLPYDPSAAKLTSVWPELRTKKAGEQS